MPYRAVLFALLVVLAARPVAAQDDPLTTPYPPDACSNCAAWNEPQAPFRLHGNSYFVGTRGLGAVLITSPEGHVLIDGGLPDSAPRILASLRALGVDPADVRLLLNTHAHYDHAGGLAALQRATGARVAASPASADVIERGQVGPDDPQHGIHFAFPAVARVERFTPGDTLRVGPLAVASHATAGHTPGGTSWSWTACDGADCRALVYADSQTPVSADGFRYTDSAAYPDAVADFERGHATLEGLACDILVNTHTDAEALRARLAEGEADPGACRRYAENARRLLAERLEREAEAR